MGPKAPQLVSQGGWLVTRLGTSPRLPIYNIGFAILPPVYRALNASDPSLPFAVALHYNPFKCGSECLWMRFQE